MIQVLNFIKLRFHIYNIDNNCPRIWVTNFSTLGLQTIRAVGIKPFIMNDWYYTAVQTIQRLY